ncbi:MAG: hydrolase [Planctomycetales bacterium]|nr:hydrolase [Planctomycetales bacterium]
MDAYAWLESQSRAMQADVTELANQNSGSSNLPGLLAVADWLEDWMDLRHTSFERIHLPPRRMVSDGGQELAMEAGPALRWDFQADKPRRVLLAIHYDTVFSPDDEFQCCQWLSTDKLTGPGVADAKGGIVILRYALQALSEFSMASEIGWTVLLNPDEELGSPSSADLLQAVAPEFDFGLLFEPAMPDGSLVSQRKGSGNFDIVVRGQAAHAGRHFEAGRNAVVALSRLLLQLDALNGQRPGLTVNVGSVRGGQAVNVVPDVAVGKVNVRLADRGSVHWFEQQLRDLVAMTDALEGFSCRCFGRIASPPKLITAEMQQLMSAVENSATQTGGHDVRWQSTGGVCDGNKLAAAGLPNIDTLGPLGDGLHSAAEWLQTSSLVPKAQLIVNLLSRFSQGEFAELTRPNKAHEDIPQISD